MGETMASHFMHLLLSSEGLDRMNLNEEETLQFLAGAVLPDAAEFRNKKQTHYRQSRWNAMTGPDSLTTAFNRVPAWLLNGWEIHLDLDRLWQKICLRPSLIRLPGLMLHYGLHLSSRYYEELSGFDVKVRRTLPEQRLLFLEDAIQRLQTFQIPSGLPIDDERWINFLNLLKRDLTKDFTYSGPPIIGWQRFEGFCHQSRQLIGLKTYRIQN